MAANRQTKTVDLGYESAENWQLSSTSTIAIVIITQPVSWYAFYRPTKGGRLSWPKHCSKGAQPVLKTVYRSSCRDKHNCQRRDSNLGPLTSQSDALTTRPLRPASIVLKHWTDGADVWLKSLLSQCCKEIRAFPNRNSGTLSRTLQWTQNISPRRVDRDNACCQPTLSDKRGRSAC